MALLPYFSLFFHSHISLSPDITLYYIHFEINSDPYNLIGSYWFDLLTNHTIIGSKLHFFPKPTRKLLLLKHNNQSDFKACLK